MKCVKELTTEELSETSNELTCRRHTDPGSDPFPCDLPPYHARIPALITPHVGLIRPDDTLPVTLRKCLVYAC